MNDTVKNEHSEASAGDTLPKSAKLLADIGLGVLWLASLPLLYLFLADIWGRTDVSLLVFLPLVSMPFIVPLCKLGGAVSFQRTCWATGGLLLAGVLALVGAFILSPWVALLAVVIGSASWALLRMASFAWHRPCRALVPLAVLLVLPIADAADWTETLEVQVAGASGTLLDLLSVPHLVDYSEIRLRFDAPLDSSLACRNIASPYVLFCVSALLLMVASRSLSSALLALATVPLWSWLLSTMHLTAAAWLWEQKDTVIFAGPTRNLISQFCFLILGLGCVFLTRVVISNLLAPLANISSDASWTHALFNRLAMWPNLDAEMLEEVRTKDREDDRQSRVFDSRFYLAITAVCILAFAASGIIGIQRASASEARFSRLGLVERQDSLPSLKVPEQIGELRRIGSMTARASESEFADQLVVGWTYANSRRRVLIELRTPQRGAVNLEKRYLNQVRRESEPRSTILQYRDSLGAFLVSDVMLLDELYGRSYLCYVNLTASGEAPVQTIAFGQRLSLRSLKHSLTLQPTAYTLSFFVEGTERLSEEERVEYHEILLQFAESLATQLQQ